MGIQDDWLGQNKKGHRGSKWNDRGIRDLDDLSKYGRNVKFHVTEVYPPPEAFGCNAHVNCGSQNKQPASQLPLSPTSKAPASASSLRAFSRSKMPVHDITPVKRQAEKGCCRTHGAWMSTGSTTIIMAHHLQSADSRPWAFYGCNAQWSATT